MTENREKKTSLLSQEEKMDQTEEIDEKPNNCLENFRKTLPLKIVLFSFSGGAICIFPFLALQMQLLGLTIKEIALLFLLNPISSLLGPIVAGLIADKTGKFSTVFLWNVIFAAILSNFLLLVPAIEKSTIHINCNSDSTITGTFADCHDCLFKIGKEQRSLVVENCKPCEIADREDYSECYNQTSNSFQCPVLEEVFETLVNIANPIPSANNSCIFNIFQIHQNNLSYESISTCSQKKLCDFKCEIKTHIEECEGSKTYISTTFIAFGCLLFIGNFFFSAAFTMMDASLLTFVREHNLELGKQRIMIMLGFAVSPIIAGLLLDLYTNKTGIVSYMPAFLLADVLFIIGIITLTRVELKGDINDSNIFKDLGKLVTRIEVDAFLLVILILGCNLGFIETYLFIFLKSLGAPGFLLGLTMTVGCLSSIPMLFYAELVENKIGRQNIFLLCFSAYAARMVGYSFIQNPWMCLIFETLEAFTYQLLWVTCLKMCPLLAPKGLLATMTGVCGAIHYSFGKGIGGFFGGFLIDLYGIRIAYRIFGGIAISGSIVYLIIHHTILKKKLAIREKEFKEENLKKAEAEKLLNHSEKRKVDHFLDSKNDLHHSLMCLTGSGTQISMASSNSENLTWNLNTNVRQRIKEDDINCSVPQMYILHDDHNLMESERSVSKSTGNLPS